MKKFTTWDLLYAVNMAIGGIAYAVVTLLLGRFVDRHDDLLAGMWAVVATVFVYRDTRDNSLSAGLDRLLATCVSFALCLVYLLLFRFDVLGMAVMIGLGTVAMALLDRREDIVTTGITTAVVLVVAHRALAMPGTSRSCALSTRWLGWGSAWRASMLGRTLFIEPSENPSDDDGSGDAFGKSVVRHSAAAGRA
jgi:Aromatic acid exporter family member 1